MNARRLARISTVRMAIWWALTAMLLQWSLIALTGSGINHLIRVALSDAGVSNLILLAANFGMIQVFRTYQPARTNYFYRFGIIALVALVYTFLSRAVLVGEINPGDDNYRSYFDHT